MVESGTNFKLHVKLGTAADIMKYHLLAQSSNTEVEANEGLPYVYR